MSALNSMRYAATKGVYDCAAKDWMKSHSDLEYWREEFELFKQILPNGRVLDIGCGFGRDFHFFHDGGYDYFGIDFSEGLLQEAKIRYPGSAGSFLNLDMRLIKHAFGENFFDGFWAAASLLHIAKDGIRDVLKGIHCVTRDKGVGFISLKEGEGEQLVHDPPHLWTVSDIRFFAFYEEDEFRKILEECGFEVLEFRKRERSKTKTIWLEFFVKYKKEDGKNEK